MHASGGPLVNATDPNEIAFGINATSFIRTISLAIAQTLSPERNEIIVTDLDHDANIATWQTLEPMGATITVWPMRDNGTLHVDDLAELLSERTRLLACTAAFHVLGSLTNIVKIARLAHTARAEMFVDCVHYTPHGAIDVADWDCDYLVCSGYKAFPPHMGFLWGKRDKLRQLPTFREGFIPDEPPFKIEAGTFIYENVAGMSAAVDYIGQLGASLRPATVQTDARSDIVSAMEAIQAYEKTLSARSLDILNSHGAVIYGPDDSEGRVPTISFNIPSVHPADLVKRLSDANIGVRDGHMYAPRLMARWDSR